MARLREVRTQKGIKAKDLARSVGTDESMMSKFENYHCLPVPFMLLKITQELECTVDDLYESSEIYLQGVTVKTTRKKKKSGAYKLTVTLPGEARETVNMAVKRCGYRNITDWATRCFEKLKKEYDKILEQEKGLRPCEGKRSPNKRNT